ncbi:MAG: bacteriohopanetetrol glucosamine biosynthesis glycosyltransferase HpnI [Acidobacteria bacterium]|nr:bacteriohopanetetrol glucosamine biosynthesis glycosyltransferase HpnI [Acidobacteriota bacterium]
MTHVWREILAAAGAFGACSAMAYYVLCMAGAATFRKMGRRALPPAHTLPPLSILKPLKGTDPGMLESFRSHCVQDYPEYEVIFGVSDPHDPAVPLVEQLQKEFPGRAIRLVVCRQVLGTNMKVSNLIQMLPQARYEHIVVNDSDIRVPHEYLRRLMAGFSPGSRRGGAGERRADIGLVTCLYRGEARRTLGSKLEALGISTEFHAGVLAARRLEGGIRFALGSSLAFTRAALNAIGGFRPLVDYLADDYELGARIAAAGYQVELSTVVVDTYLPAYSLPEFFRHQLRWARSTRHSRQWGWAGVGLTFALPWSVLAVLGAGGAPWSWGMLALALAMRVLVALVVGWGVLRDRQVLRYLFLLPLREFAGLAVWIGSYTGHTVDWRGDEFVLKDGKLLRSGELAIGGD